MRCFLIHQFKRVFCVLKRTVLWSHRLGSFKNQQYLFWLRNKKNNFLALRPKSTAMVIAGRSVHLTTLFSWASLTKHLTHTFACNWQQPFLEDSEEGRRMTIRKYGIGPGSNSRTVLKRTVSLRRFYWVPSTYKCIFKLINKKIIL